MRTSRFIGNLSYNASVLGRKHNIRCRGARHLLAAGLRFCVIKNSKSRQPPNPGRRNFLSRSFAWATSSLMASPLRNLAFARPFRDQLHPAAQAMDDHLVPHYRQPAPIDAVLRQVEPGLDGFITEKYAEQIKVVLEKWSRELTQSPAEFGAVESSLAQNLRASSLIPSQHQPLRPLAGLEVFRNRFPDTLGLGRPQFIDEFRRFMGTFSKVHTAEFKVTRISLDRK